MHLVIINGSPRIQQYSNTDKIIKAFSEGFEKSGNTTELYSISARSKWDDAKDAFLKNSNILIALPLYVECVPGLLLEFLETLPVKNDNTKIAFILQSGFAEGVQLRCGEAFLKQLPAHLGCEYAGTLVKGDNFSIRVVPESISSKIAGQYMPMGEIFARDENFFSEECRKFTGVERFGVGFRLLIGMMFKTITKGMFVKVAKEWGCTKPLDYRPF